ncbi:MAG: dihydrolipoamide acetyltransferase family protein [Phycisphaerales bacterium JB040]
MAGKVSSDPNVFILPDLGEGLEEAELVAWKVSEGDSIEEHDILAEMETDKALVEVPSPRTGVIKTLHGDAGDIIKVGAPLVTYEGGGESAPASPKESDTGKHAAKTRSDAEASSDEDQGTVVGKMGDATPGMTAREGKALATPAVRRLARDLGVDIDDVPGSGIGGRVTKKDVEDFKNSGGASAPKARPASDNGAASAPARPAETRRPLPSAGQQAPTYQPQPTPQPMQPQMGMQQHTMHAMQQGMMPHQGMGMMMVPMMVPMGVFGAVGAQQAGLPAMPGFTPFQSGKPVPDPAQSAAPGQDSRVPFRGVRRMIASRLRESVNTAVHFTVMDEADVTALDAHRRQLAQTSGEKVSFLPFVCAAVARALSTRFGALNATVDEEAEEIVQHGAVHLGIATDTDSGLMVPVVRDAERMGVLDLGRAIAHAASSARDRSIAREDLMGSTFTISNVGSHAGKFATPVINAPEVGILAVGKAYDGVVVHNGQPAVGKIMPLSLACDHRVVDGATAALMLAEVVRTLTHEPETLIG